MKKMQAQIKIYNYYLWSFVNWKFKGTRRVHDGHWLPNWTYIQERNALRIVQGLCLLQMSLQMYNLCPEDILYNVYVQLACCIT